VILLLCSCLILGGVSVLDGETSEFYTGPQGRFQTLGYLGARFTALFGRLGRPIHWALNLTCLRQWTVPINLGDLFTVYARKVQSVD
jgi:hypothetical protein